MPADLIQNQIDSINQTVRILLVEDELLIRELIKELLRKQPFDIDVAENGKSGVEMIRKHTFDLVLMDMKMPVMDGYMATQEIRDWENHNQAGPIPIIALTANVTTDEVERCMASGCTSHLCKPINRQSLVAAILKFRNVKKQ